jgi:hypothetical protein
MLEGYIELFELCIAMVTALLGLAYLLFIDKINQMSDKYKTRRISEKLKNEIAYCCFNILIVEWLFHFRSNDRNQCRLFE